ncbi:MAG: helix-turn-helix transcriptional regulator [Hyphomicrobium sp.]
MKAHVSRSARDAALALIKTAMIEKKLTQAQLADAADCHEKTIQNLLSGRSVRDQTLFDVCMVLGLDFDKVKGAWNGPRRRPRGAPPSCMGKTAARSRRSIWGPTPAPPSTSTSAAT